MNDLRPNNGSDPGFIQRLPSGKVQGVISSTISVAREPP